MSLIEGKRKQSMSGLRMAMMEWMLNVDGAKDNHKTCKQTTTTLTKMNIPLEIRSHKYKKTRSCIWRSNESNLIISRVDRGCVWGRRRLNQYASETVVEQNTSQEQSEDTTQQTTVGSNRIENLNKLTTARSVIIGIGWTACEEIRIYIGFCFQPSTNAPTTRWSQNITNVKRRLSRSIQQCNFKMLVQERPVILFDTVCWQCSELSKWEMKHEIQLLSANAHQIFNSWSSNRFYWTCVKMWVGEDDAMIGKTIHMFSFWTWFFSTTSDNRSKQNIAACSSKIWEWYPSRATGGLGTFKDLEAYVETNFSDHRGVERNRIEWNGMEWDMEWNKQERNQPSWMKTRKVSKKKKQ